MSSQLAVVQSHTPRSALLPSPTEWRTMLEMAADFLKSGLLPSSIKTPQAVVVIMQKGLELDVPPMAALNGIHVINGKPVCSAELMLSLIYRDHGDSAVRFEETSNQACRVLYRRRAWPEPGRFAFTIEDAKAAGLVQPQSNYTKYPAAMLRARCISAVARLAFPDSIGGMYTPEELGAEVAVEPDGAIQIIETTLVPTPAAIVEDVRAESRQEVASAPETAPETAQSGPSLLADKTRRALHAAAADKTEGDGHALIKRLATARYGVLSTNDLTDDQAQELVRWFGARKPYPEADILVEWAERLAAANDLDSLLSVANAMGREGINDGLLRDVFRRIKTAVQAI